MAFDRINIFRTVLTEENRKMGDFVQDYYDAEFIQYFNDMRSYARNEYFYDTLKVLSINLHVPNKELRSKLQILSDAQKSGASIEKIKNIREDIRNLYRNETPAHIFDIVKGEFGLEFTRAFFEFIYPEYANDVRAYIGETPPVTQQHEHIQEVVASNAPVADGEPEPHTYPTDIDGDGVIENGELVQVKDNSKRKKAK